MDRSLMQKLIAWKGALRRKPLILDGARQVGKTWLLKEFGRLHFNNVAYVSLDTDAVARSLFERDLDAKRIVRELGILTNQAIDPGETLIVFDEVQAQPKAITALKYFCEDAPEYAVAAAGSLLGLSAHFGSGYPVGKVDTLNLHPLSFCEYLRATGNASMDELLNGSATESINAFSPKATALLKEYYVVGGMPAVVDAHITGSDFAAIRAAQEQILEGYQRDFAKHAPRRIYARMVDAWLSIPQHLSQENKKFVFGHVRKGSRAKDYEESLTWFEQAGLIRKVPRVTKPGIPLSAYNDNKGFKVFMLDVGLLGAMSGLQPESILEGNAVLTEFKGALTEQYVCQQLVSECGMAPFYWSAENSIGEIDFLVQNGSHVFALEAKTEENLRSKSLRSFKEAHREVDAVRLSISGYRKQNWMRNVPLYAMSNLELWSR